MVHTGGSQSVVPALQTQSHLGICQICKLLALRRVILESHGSAGPGPGRDPASRLLHWVLSQ